MAFECPKATEIDLSKNPVNSVDNTCADQTEFDQIKPYSNPKNLIFVSQTSIEESGKQKSVSGVCPKKGSVSSYSGKLLPRTDVLANFGRSITDLPSALISEILNSLDPKELGIVSCVSTYLHRLASEHHGWKEFYCERWGHPPIPTPLPSGCENDKSWKELFVGREFRSKTFMGKYSIEVLRGHTESIRTVFILSSKKLIFTAGYDSTVRMWDMEEGLSIAASRPLGCTIRAVAADTKLLVAGGTDGFIHGWKAEEGLSHLFNLRGPQNQKTEFRIWEHEGPITCLALDMTRIYSGSWDMTVRVWDRSLLKCVHVLRHNDWVWGLVPHDTTLVSSSGTDVCVWDTNSGTQIAEISDTHAGNTYSVARSHTGKLLFTGGEDGAIRMFEISINDLDANVRKVATWTPHTGPVYSLAFEFPWLVSASSDGKLSLIDVRRLLKTNKCSTMVEPPQRMLHGFSCNLFSVDIGFDRIVCGGEEGVVRIWNFSEALEIEQKARAMKGIRLENRMRRRRLHIGGRSDQCSVAAKTNPMNGDKNGVWHNKRGVSGKLKA